MSVTVYEYNQIGRTLPIFRMPLCGDPIEPIFSDCDHHIKNATTKLKNTQRYYKCLGEYVEVIERVMECVEESCEGEFPLSDADKTKLYEVLTRLENYVNRHGDRYDRYITDVESFIEKYNRCKEDEPPPPLITW